MTLDFHLGHIILDLCEEDSMEETSGLNKFVVSKCDNDSVKVYLQVNKIYFKDNKSPFKEFVLCSLDSVAWITLTAINDHFVLTIIIETTLVAENVRFFG